MPALLMTISTSSDASAASSYPDRLAHTDLSTHTHTGPDVSGRGSQEPYAPTDRSSGSAGHGRHD